MRSAEPARAQTALFRATSQLGFAGGFLELELRARNCSSERRAAGGRFPVAGEFVELGLVVSGFAGFGIFTEFEGCGEALR